MYTLLLQVRNFMDKCGKYFDKPPWIIFHLLLQETKWQQTDRPLPDGVLWYGIENQPVLLA